MAVGKPVVLVLLNGSALAINWANEHVPAILEAWYPGQAGGEALAAPLMRWLAGQELTLRHFGLYEPSLTDIFIQKVGEAA